MFNKAWQLSVLPQNDRVNFTDIGHVFYIRHRVKVLYTRDLDLPSTTWLDFIFFDHSKSEKHCIWTDTQFPSDEALTLLTDPVVSPCCVIITHTVSGLSFCFLHCGCVTIVDSHTMSVLSITTSVNFLLWRSDNRHKFVTILCLYLV